MAQLRTTSRHGNSLFSAIEGLERRLFLDSTPFAIGNEIATVYDDARSVLYVAASAYSSATKLERYEVATRRTLDAFDLGFSPAAMDVSPDGKFLYGIPGYFSNGVGELYRVDLESGATRKTTFAAPDSGGGTDLVVAANGSVFFTDRPSSSAWSTDPVLRQFDPATGVVSNYGGGFDAAQIVGARYLLSLSRSADHGRLVLAYGYQGDRYLAVLDGQSLGTVSNVKGGYSTYAPTSVNKDATLFADRQAVVDASLNTVRSVSGLGNVIDAVAFDPERPRFYVRLRWWSTMESKITVFDTNTWQQVATLPSSYSEDFDNITPTADGTALLLTGNSGLRSVPLRTSPRVSVTSPYSRSNVPHTVSISMEDPGGAAAGWSGTLRFVSDDPAATLPPDMPVTLAPGEVLTFDATFPTPGKHVIDVLDVSNGAFGRAEIKVDDAGPTAQVSGGYAASEWDPGGPYRVYASIVDDFELDQATVDDPDVELVAIAPDGTAYPITYGFIDPPDPPGLMCSGDCQKRYDNWGFYPQSRGTYVVRMVPGSAADTLGNLAVGGEVGTLRVDSIGGGGGAVVGTEDLAAALADVAPRFGKRPAVTGSLVISNEGFVRGSGTSRVTVSLVPDADPPAAPRELRAWDQSLKLAPGKSRRFKLRLPVPQDLPEGSYRLVAHVAPIGGVSGVEPSDANNAASSEPFPLRPSANNAPPRVDATLSTAHASLSPPTPLTIAVRLHNAIDAGPSEGRYALSVVATPAPGGPDDSPDSAVGRTLGPIVRRLNLAPGASQDINLKVKLPKDLTPGTYLLTASVLPL